MPGAATMDARGSTSGRAQAARPGPALGESCGHARRVRAWRPCGGRKVEADDIVAPAPGPRQPPPREDGPDGSLAGPGVVGARGTRVPEPLASVRRTRRGIKANRRVGHALLQFATGRPGDWPEMSAIARVSTHLLQAFRHVLMATEAARCLRESSGRPRGPNRNIMCPGRTRRLPRRNSLCSAWPGAQKQMRSLLCYRFATRRLSRHTACMTPLGTSEQGIQSACGRVSAYPPMSDARPYWRVTYTMNGVRHNASGGRTGAVRPPKGCPHPYDSGFRKRKARTCPVWRTARPVDECAAGAAVSPSGVVRRIPGWTRWYVDKYLRPVLAQVRAIDVTKAHYRQILNMAPTQKEGNQVKRRLSSFVKWARRMDFLSSQQQADLDVAAVGQPQWGTGTPVPACGGPNGG